MTAPPLTVRTVPVRNLPTGGHRRQLGDIETLAADIAENGVLHPVTLTRAGELIAGQRRLAAARLAGLAEVPARTVATVEAAVAALQEDLQRGDGLPMPPSERVALAAVVERLPRSRRQPSHGTRRGRSVAEIVGEAVGLPSSSAYRAREVVRAAAAVNAPPEAVAALEHMDTTGQVAPAYQLLRKTRSADLTTERRRPRQSAAAQRRVLTSGVAHLLGLSESFEAIDEIAPGLTETEREEFVNDLAIARRRIEQLIRRLRGGASRA